MHGPRGVAVLRWSWLVTRVDFGPLLSSKISFGANLTFHMQFIRGYEQLISARRAANTTPAVSSGVWM